MTKLKSDNLSDNLSSVIDSDIITSIAKQKAIREDIIKRWDESGLLKGLHTSDKNISFFETIEKVQINEPISGPTTDDLPESNSLLELTEQEKIDRANGKDALPEGWIDWDKIPLEEIGGMLVKQYTFNSTDEAKMYLELINSNSEYKDCSESKTINKTTKRLLSASRLGINFDYGDGHRWLNFYKEEVTDEETMYQKLLRHNINPDTKMYGNIIDCLNFIDFLLLKMGELTLEEDFDRFSDWGFDDEFVGGHTPWEISGTEDDEYFENCFKLGEME